jgi:hypothetical protein
MEVLRQGAATNNQEVTTHSFLYVARDALAIYYAYAVLALFSSHPLMSVLQIIAIYTILYFFVAYVLW